jgi:ABC-type transport system involved in multi-copper enzyme maturation permease subunit
MRLAMDVTAATERPATAITPPGSGAAHAVDVLAAEWLKFRTVRSTWWALTAVIVFNVVPAGALGAVLPAALNASQQAGITSPVRLSLAGLHLSQIAIGVLGVLVITSEYTSGMIRASLAATPQRRLLLAAKTAVLTVAAVAAGLATCWAAYFAFQLLLPGGSPLRVPLSDPGVVRAVTGAGLYLAALALLGLGLGAILRSSAGAMTALFGLLFVPTLITALLPASWQDTVGKYLPMNAGESAYALRLHAEALAPWIGLGVFCAYAAAALAAGFILITRRDA